MCCLSDFQSPDASSLTSAVDVLGVACWSMSPSTFGLSWCLLPWSWPGLKSCPVLDGAPILATSQGVSVALITRASVAVAFALTLLSAPTSSGAVSSIVLSGMCPKFAWLVRLPAGVSSGGLMALCWRLPPGTHPSCVPQRRLLVLPFPPPPPTHTHTKERTLRAPRFYTVPPGILALGDVRFLDWPSQRNSAPVGGRTEL